MGDGVEQADTVAPHLGDELHELCTELFPICRSITGDGVRETLEILRALPPARRPRGAVGHACARLDGAA